MKGKTVIITGGSSGIGKALAREFGKKGSHILITGRERKELDKTVHEFRNMGIIIHAYQGDVSVEEDNKKMVEVAVGRYNKIDILINNAGISMKALFEETKLSVMKKIMDINFFGTLYATHYCLPYIIKNEGSVVGISSIAGYRGLPARSGYSASKFAVNGFLEALRSEMLKKKVHILTACPGFTGTNIRKRSLTKDGSMQGTSPRDEKKMMTADACARHIYRACLKRKKILILTRQGKLAVFLNKWIPGLMDRIVYNVMAREENTAG